MIIYSAFVLALTLTYVFLFLFYLTGWVTLPEYKFSGRQPHTKVSIIIAARNEEAGIGDLIRDLLKQNLPSHLFEIIIVDDFSDDRTAEIVSSFQSGQIRLLQLREEVTDQEIIFSYKKKALETGIEKAPGSRRYTSWGNSDGGLRP